MDRVRELEALGQWARAYVGDAGSDDVRRLFDTEMGRRLAKGAMGVEDIRDLDEGSAFGQVFTPEEVADAVRFLVSEQAAYLTAQRVGVDGGAF